MNEIPKRNVPFFNYPDVYLRMQNQIQDIVHDVCGRGAFILQRDLAEFEKSFARFTGANYAVGVANCTDGLHLMLRAAGIGSGDEVIFSSHTMVATAAAIYFAGASPIPVDCGADHLMDPSKLEEAITDQTRAIMPTQLNGRTCAMDRICEIADRKGLLIFEDAAQALGSNFKGKQAGTWGIAGAFSFYPAKSLGCLGDGGAVITNDEDIYKKLLLLRDHGRNEKGDVELWGANSRLDNLQAAVLSLKLQNFSDEIKRRREIAALYHELLEGLRNLILPPPPGDAGPHFDTFQNYEIEAEDRDQLKEYLRENGIGTIIQWGGKAVHQFRALGFHQKLPYTEKVFKRCLLLPMNTSLTNDDVSYVCSRIKQFYSN